MIYLTTLFDQLDKNQLKELLIKCWMTHDGSWFYNCAQKYGIDAANKLNKAAIKALSTIEMQRIEKALKLENTKINDFEALKKFIDDAFSVLKGDFMDFKYSFPENNQIHWEMKHCFAYNGMKMIGVIEDYECGVIYRVSCWLTALGIQHRVIPRIKQCLLNSQDKCVGDIFVKL